MNEDGEGGKLGQAPGAFSGEETEVRARELLSMMTLEEKVRAMSGDQPFWPGMSEMMREGYNLRPYLAGENTRLGCRVYASPTARAGWSRGPAPPSPCLWPEGRPGTLSWKNG